MLPRPAACVLQRLIVLQGRCQRSGTGQRTWLAVIGDHDRLCQKATENQGSPLQRLNRLPCPNASGVLESRSAVRSSLGLFPLRHGQMEARIGENHDVASIAVECAKKETMKEKYHDDCPQRMGIVAVKENKHARVRR